MATGSLWIWPCSCSTTIQQCFPFSFKGKKRKELSVYCLHSFRTEKQDNHFSPSEHDNQRTFDGFSETQTESQVFTRTILELLVAVSRWWRSQLCFAMQVVGYEEDLSGRQMIIERCRTRSSAWTTGSEINYELGSEADTSEVVLVLIFIWKLHSYFRLFIYWSKKLWRYREEEQVKERALAVQSHIQFSCCIQLYSI